MVITLDDGQRGVCCSAACRLMEAALAAEPTVTKIHYRIVFSATEILPGVAFSPRRRLVSPQVHTHLLIISIYIKKEGCH